MAAIKISSKVDESAWNDLKALAKESHQTVSGLLTDAIREYLRRRRIRPVVLRHLEDSMTDNEKPIELELITERRSDGRYSIRVAVGGKTIYAEVLDHEQLLVLGSGTRRYTEDQLG